MQNDNQKIKPVVLLLKNKIKTIEQLVKGMTGKQQQLAEDLDIKKLCSYPEWVRSQLIQIFGVLLNYTVEFTKRNRQYHKLNRSTGY